MTGFPPWLRDPALVPVWSAVRDRLQRNGIEVRGAVTVRGLDRPARHAVGGLLGRAVVRDAVRMDLAELDRLLVERAGQGLVAVVTALTGPLTDLVALRSERDAERQAPFTAARAWLDDHPEAQRPETEQWLEAVRTSGVLSRVADSAVASRCLVQAAQVVAALTADGSRLPAARSELAARHTGDAHALDDGALCGALVLRALAISADDEPPRTPARRRSLWEAFGIASDTVSSTVLTLGLRPVAGGALAARLREAAGSGDPLHLTAWDLSCGDVAVSAGTAVLVCENPRVLEAAAAEHGGRHPVVCSSGMPAAVVLRLLMRLRAGGAVLRYHGDFDWPGIAIANRLVAGVGCVPWAMAVEDYRSGVRPDGLPLSGAPVTPAWDVELGSAMQRAGVAVHEEAVLDELLRRLPELRAG